VHIELHSHLRVTATFIEQKALSHMVHAESRSETCRIAATPLVLDDGVKEWIRKFSTV
jgi:hypothetical protein